MSRTSNPTPGSKRGYEAVWEARAADIAHASLPGLALRCPSCQRSGWLISKWVPKTPIKPLFAVHRPSNGELTACSLDQDQSARLRQQISFTSADVTKILRMGKPYVMFSGGSDSVCVLQYVKGLADRAGIPITAIHADTTAGFPEVEEYVKEVCALLGVELVTVHPAHDYFDIAKRWGIPGVRSRWCCETLKIAPIRRHLAEVENPKVIIDGIRAAESPVRAKYVPVWVHPAFRCISASPIFYWSDTKVDGYIRRSGLPPNPTADMGTSGECWCGAYKCKADFEALLEVHPEIFDKLVEVEEAQRGTYTFLYENGERVALRSLKD